MRRTFYLSRILFLQHSNSINGGTSKKNYIFIESIEKLKFNQSVQIYIFVKVKYDRTLFIRASFIDREFH